MAIYQHIKNMILIRQTHRKLFDIPISIALSSLPLISLNVPNGNEMGMILCCWACIIAYYIIKIRDVKKHGYNIKIVITKLDILLGILFLYIIIRNSLSLTFFDLYEFLKLSSCILVINIIKNIKLRSTKIVYLSLIISATIQSIIAMLQIFKILSSNHGIFLATGSFDNPAINGIFIASIFPLIFGMIFYTQEPSDHYNMYTRHYVLYALLWCMLMAIASSASRSAWIGVVSSSVLIVLKYYKPIRKYPIFHCKKSIYSICIICILVFIILLYYFKPISANSRVYIWLISLKVFILHPLCGVGSSFSYNFLHAQADYFLQNPNSAFVNTADNIHHCYNVFLQVLTQYGIIGIILYCSVILCIYKCRCRSSLWVIKFALFGIMLEGCFSFGISSYPLLLIISLYIGLIDRSMRNLYNSKILCPKKNYLRLRLINVASLCLGCVLLVGYTYSIICWQKGMHYFEKQEYNQADKYFSRADFMLKSNGYFWNIRGKCLSLQNKYIESNRIMAQAAMNRYSIYTEITMGDNYLALGQYEKAKQAYQTAHRILPSKMYPLYLLSMCQYKEGNVEEFKKTANLVLSMPVKVHSTATIQMRNKLSTILNEIQ